MRLAHSAFLVREYDEAIDWFSRILDWYVVKDTDLGGGKRWVRMAAQGGGELLLARATTADQIAAVGMAAGGRVAYFLHSDDFAADYERMIARGVIFTESPRSECYGQVAVFFDLYGNRWDLIGPTEDPVSGIGEAG